MAFFAQQFANGLGLGSIYALAAVGFSIVYGVLFLVNLPHGDILMSGTYIFLALTLSGVNLPLAFFVAAVLTGLLAVGVEFVAYRRMRQARRVAPLLSAIGVSYTLSNVILVIMGSLPLPFPQPFSGRLTIFGVSFPATVLATLVVTAVAVVALELFIHKSRLGTAIRAASQDRLATALMGVNINWIIAVAFFISGVLALIGGVMLGWRYGTVSPLIGFSIMLKAFVACVLGGIGSITGAMVGGFLLGVTETFIVSYVSSSYRDAITFLLLICVLLVRPNGLFQGRAETAV